MKYDQWYILCILVQDIMYFLDLKKRGVLFFREKLNVVVNKNFVFYITFLLYFYMFTEIGDPVEKINAHLPAQIRILGNYYACTL